MSTRRENCRTNQSFLMMRSFLFILLLGLSSNTLGSEMDERYLYRNFASENLSMELFKSRTNFAVGDAIQGANPCELGVSEVCYYFGNTLFAIPQDEDEVLRFSDEGVISSVSLLKKFEDSFLFGNKINLMVLESKSESHSVVFFYSLEHGIMAFSLSAEGESAIFWSVSDCGFGALASPCNGNNEVKEKAE